MASAASDAGAGFDSANSVGAGAFTGDAQPEMIKPSEVNTITVDLTVIFITLPG